MSTWTDVEVGDLPVGTIRWRVPDDIGRRYAKVSGDVNPIHMSSLTAKALGFKRAIAHGMWVKAHALAAQVKPPCRRAGTPAMRLWEQALARDRQKSGRERLLAERQRDVHHRQPSAQQQDEFVPRGAVGEATVPRVGLVATAGQQLRVRPRRVRRRQVPEGEHDPVGVQRAAGGEPEARAAAIIVDARADDVVEVVDADAAVRAATSLLSSSPS